jgi:hypothetical protein
MSSSTSAEASEFVPWSPRTETVAGTSLFLVVGVTT